MKGGTNMGLKKAFLIGGLMVALITAIPGAFVFAGEPAPPSDAEKIIGPTMWAVGVVECDSTNAATLRVKKIDGCNVDTDAQSVGSITACPASEADVINVRLLQGSVFGLPCEAIITKVKNFKNEGSIASFDAQIQFVVPNTYQGTECVPTQ
jgi:hypothetical protein